MTEMNNLPDDTFDGDPLAPWNEVDIEEELEFMRANQPMEYLQAMREGIADIDVYWLHDLGFTLNDLGDPDDERLNEFVQAAKKISRKLVKEIKKDWEWI